jgi:hypothetical protein
MESHMFKKMFALASITALTGLVASVAASGCSSTTSVNEEGGTTAVSEAGDAKKVVEAGPEEEAGPITCPTTDPIDATTAAWKPPQALPGSCTEKMITDLVAFVDANKKTPYADLKKQVTDATCAKCLFVPDGDKWGVFVEKADGTFLRNNFGGCVAVESGKEACGKAFSQFDDCLSVACQDCADDAATTKCNTAAGKGACKDAAAAFVKECGDATAVSACDDLAKTYTFEAAARALCVGIGDGGDGGDGG